MKTKDHLHLGRYLLRFTDSQMSLCERKAFLFGCVEPDLNPFTRMKLTKKKDMFMGHNAEHSRNHIEKMLNKIKASKKESVYRCFMLGSALHYLADAFTFVHNDIFEGTLDEHIQYEMDLHHHLMHVLAQNEQNQNCSVSSPLMSYVDDFHNKYRSLPQSVETDVEYIAQICEMTVRNIMQNWKNKRENNPVFS